MAVFQRARIFLCQDRLQPVLGVPVGIIGCNWGGTSASTWLEESWLKDAPLDVYLKEYEASVAGKDPEELKAAR